MFSRSFLSCKIKINNRNKLLQLIRYADFSTFDGVERGYSPVYHNWAQLRSLLLHFWGETAQWEAVQPWQSVLPLPWHPTGKSILSGNMRWINTQNTHSLGSRVCCGGEREMRVLPWRWVDLNTCIFKNNISHFFFCSICLRMGVWRTYSWIGSIASSQQNSLACWKTSSLQSRPVVSCSTSGRRKDAHETATGLRFIRRSHPFAGGGGVSLGLQAVGCLLAHRLAEHAALFLLQAFRLHHSEAASAAVLLAPHALHQNEPGLH